MENDQGERLRAEIENLPLASVAAPSEPPTTAFNLPTRVDVAVPLPTVGAPPAFGVALNSIQSGSGTDLGVSPPLELCGEVATKG